MTGEMCHLCRTETLTERGCPHCDRNECAGYGCLKCKRGQAYMGIGPGSKHL